MFLTFWLVNALGATAACNFSTISRPLNVQKWSVPLSFLTFWLENALLATAACNFSRSQLQKVARARQFFTAPCNFSTSQLQKVVRARQYFNILTLKCASRYSGVQFFHIATSKSGPRMLCFVHFDFKMRLSLQRRAIFHFSAQQPTSAPAALPRLLFDPAHPQIIEKHSISRLP